jgi:glycosyltransferase involved in cell wall biosynthesis
VIIDGDTGYLVEPGDIDAITRKLRSVLGSSSDSKVTDKAKEYYNDHFSSKTILPKWEALYSRILSD